MAFPKTRKTGQNPRALGTNERATAKNRWALRAWKRKRRALKEALRPDQPS